MSTYTKEDTFRATFCVATPSAWRGFAGEWHLNPLDPKAPSARALRLFRQTGPDPLRNLKHRNIYQKGLRIGECTDRAADGLPQAEWDRTVDSPFFEPTARDLEDRPGWADRRTVALSSEALGAIRPQIPTRLIPACEFPPNRDAARLLETPGAWGIELFIVDGDCKWSGAVFYSTETAARTGCAFIREYSVDMGEADTAIDMDTLPVLPARERLSEDPAEWLPPSPSSGPQTSSYGMQVDPETLDFRPAPDSLCAGRAWSAADTRARVSGPDAPCELLRLPDSMYLLVPKTLPVPGTAGAGVAPGAPIELEFGGVMRSGGGHKLRRTVVRFSPETGRLEAMLHDTVVV